MVLDSKTSQWVEALSRTFLGKPFIWETFNCMHFVDHVYRGVGIDFPFPDRYGLPPQEFHLSQSDFANMPIGHSVFFRRKDTKAIRRYWTHVAIIISATELIHCTRHLGQGVVITPVTDFLEVYDLSRYS